MERMFTWGGRSFGHKDGENLWTYSGKHVGKFHDDEVYGPDGRYLGELKNGKANIQDEQKVPAQEPIHPAHESYEAGEDSQPHRQCDACRI